MMARICFPFHTSLRSSILKNKHIYQDIKL